MKTYDQLMLQAEERENDGDPIRAMQLYAEAVQQAPARREPLIKLAHLFGEQGDDEGAAGFLEKALEIDPRSAYIRLQLGLNYYERGCMSDAIRHLKASVLIIQHFVSNTRIDAMFADPNGLDAVLAEVDEIEETGAQAIELLKSIAAETVSNEASAPVASERNTSEAEAPTGSENRARAPIGSTVSDRIETLRLAS